jgi:signal transduction histidine kinase
MATHQHNSTNSTTSAPEIGVILIVDDNPTNLDILSETLANGGFEVAAATSGEAALKQLQYDLPDLILLDVMMPPGIDGFETCQRLKLNSQTREIPVIFMTAVTDTTAKVKGFNLGAVDYITKPFQQQEVLARVQLHVKLQRMTKALEEQAVQLKQWNHRLEQRIAEKTTELAQSLQELQRAQLQLVQSEKLSTLGQLVAGVAHEINNPICFLDGNIAHAICYVQNLIEHVRLYQQKASAEEIARHAEVVDLNYVLEDLPKALFSMKGGAERIKDISVSLRLFSRGDNQDKVSFDVHEGIDSTLLILRYRLRANDDRPEIEVVKKYGRLPLIRGFPGQLSQVFMNILANAIDAIDAQVSNKMMRLANAPIADDSHSSDAVSHQIQIHTALADDHTHIQIRIRDSGTGMSVELQQKIFDYAFTTKPVGKGTGLGLAIAHQIVVEKHQGTLTVKSAPDEGAEFVITLPVEKDDLL